MPRRSYERTVDVHGLVRELLALNHGAANSDILEALTIELREQHRVRHHHEVGALLEAQWQLASGPAWDTPRPPAELRYGGERVAGLDYMHNTFTRKAVAQYSEVIQRFVREPAAVRGVRSLAAAGV